MTKAKFLADECTFVQTVLLMRNLGLEVQRLQELGMAGLEDDRVFEKAQDLKAVLVTNDKGFGDIRQYPLTSHCGIIILKMTPDPVRIREIHETFKRLLEKEDQFEGALFIVDIHKYRVRRKPLYPNVKIR
jgi:predicted nuclease of predicted toxin-antitoxin system